MNERAAPVRLYVGPAYRDPNLSHLPLLYPFWGVVAKESMPFVAQAAQQYQFSDADFTLVDAIEEAEYVLIPHDYRVLSLRDPARIEMIRTEARKAGKLLLADVSGDLEFAIPDPDTVVLRLSQYRYAVRDNEITVPFLAEDLTDTWYGGTAPCREKGELPVVGFTGWARVSFIQRIKIFLKELPLTFATIFNPQRGAEHKGILFRARALRRLAGRKDIKFQGTSRSTYSGHIKTVSGEVKTVRKEFVESLAGVDYALCVKGDANASVRFYEALSLGRIPLFVDTACVLPLEDRIAYKDFCVFIDWRDIDRIGTVLADFHANCSPERFLQMQQQSRNAFVQYLRTDAFSPHLASQLRVRADAHYTPKN